MALLIYSTSHSIAIIYFIALFAASLITLRVRSVTTRGNPWCSLGGNCLRVFWKPTCWPYIRESNRGKGRRRSNRLRCKRKPSVGQGRNLSRGGLFRKEPLLAYRRKRVMPYCLFVSEDGGHPSTCCLFSMFVHRSQCLRRVFPHIAIFVWTTKSNRTAQCRVC